MNRAAFLFSDRFMRDVLEGHYALVGDKTDAINIMLATRFNAKVVRRSQVAEIKPGRGYRKGGQVAPIGWKAVGGFLKFAPLGNVSWYMAYPARSICWAVLYNARNRRVIGAFDLYGPINVDGGIFTLLMGDDEITVEIKKAHRPKKKRRR